MSASTSAKTERHRHERVAEPRLRHRREVAVEEPPERQLQRVLRAKRERDDAGVDRRERAETCGDRDPPLERARHARAHAARSAGNRARRSSARDRGTRSSARRAPCVVGPPAPYAFSTGGAGTRTPNVHTPETTCESAEIACHRTVYAPSFRCRTWRDRRPCPSARAGAGEVLADAVQHADRAGQHLHLLVEPQADDRRPLLAAPSGTSASSTEASRAPTRPPGTRARRARRARARLIGAAVPASGDRWPKIGATSRSEKSWIETTTITAANAGLEARPSAAGTRARAARARRR